MNRPLTIAVDVDEVCAQLHREWIMRYNADYNDTKTADDFTDWDIEKLVKPECGDRIFTYLRDPNLYHCIVPYPDAVQGINRLRERGHRVVFLTSCARGSVDQKINWLEEWGFLPASNRTHRDFIAAHDKSIIKADVLIDDAIHNVDAWHGVSILITRPHNANHQTWHYRADGLLAAADMIQRLHPMALQLPA